jgi:hypothetical protein
LIGFAVVVGVSVGVSLGVVTVGGVTVSSG